ncbi:MAG: hypothetical protein JRF72_15175 [Deltaproteobacteria bacterium]|nr:hypothetical protein [Deltaproteobacteria bacterium]
MNKKKKRLLIYSLGALQAFIGITAIAGGFRLVSNPNGTVDIPIQWLNNSPFTSYLIPGLVLLIVIGFGNVLAGTVSFLKKRYAGGIAAILGTFLICFMTIEVWFVGLRNFLQPLYFILGAIVLILGLKLFKLFMAVPMELESKTHMELESKTHKFSV